MKVSISVPGRFWAFQLAKHLHENNSLHCLVTSFPAFEVKKYGIPSQNVKSIISKEIFQRLYKIITGKYPRGVWLNNWFDLIASYKLPKDSDVYIIWAGFGSYSFKRLKKKNPKALFILERGSAHIEVQNNLMKLYYKKGEPINSKIIAKEKYEYDNFDYIMLPGIFSKNSFIEKGVPATKLFINHYGVDLNLFKGELKNKIRSKDFIIGYAGQISDRKNIKGIINACNILISNGYNIRLYLAGVIDKNSFDENFEIISCNES